MSGQTDKGLIIATSITAVASIIGNLLTIFVYVPFQRQIGFDEGLNEGNINIEQLLEEAHASGYSQGFASGETSIEDFGQAEDLLAQYLEQIEEYQNRISDLENEINTLRTGNTVSLESTPVQNSQRISLYRGAPAFDNYPFDLSHSAHEIGHTNSVIMSGETFRDVIVSQRINSGGTNFTLHNLGGQFQLLSGYIGRVDGSHMVDATIIFFGDGEYLDSVTISATDMPVPFSVDIQDIIQLRIETELPRGGRYAIQAFVE